MRTTTRECVHLVRRGHFRSRDNVGDHAIRSVITENSTLHANFMAKCGNKGRMRRREEVMKKKRNFFMSSLTVRSFSPNLRKELVRTQLTLMSVPLLIDPTRLDPRVYPYP